MVQHVIAELRERDIHVSLARLESERAARAAVQTGLIAALGSDRVFRSVEDALRGPPSSVEPPRP
jgi:hypothetical protein